MDRLGDIGIIRNAIDLHNIYVDFPDEGFGRYCQVKSCDQYDPLTILPLTKIHLAYGIPGSGKSTWFAKNFDVMAPTVAIISRDLARIALTGDIGNHDYEVRVTDLVNCQYLGAIKNPMVTDILVDNTMVKYKSRKEFYKLAERSGYPIEFHLIVFNNFEEAIVQNQNRERVVPDVSMQFMLDNFEPPKPEDINRCTTITDIKSVRNFEATITYPKIKA